MTQTELAKRSGIGQPVISDIERRGTTQRLNLDVLDRLCAALALEPGDLLQREPNGRRRKNR